MADPSPNPVGDRPATPVWVKTLGVAALVVAVLVVVVMVVGGGQHGPALHAPSDGAGLQTPAPSEAGTLDVGTPADADEAARTVEINARDTLVFEPASVSVAAGEAITFVVTNTGQAVHEFTLGDAAMQQEHADAMAHLPAGVAHELPNSITLRPGETKQLTWRFGDAVSLEFACHEPGHYDGGMRGQIDVG